MEKGWYDVSEGKLTEQEIHESCCEFKAKIEEATHSNLKSNSLPKNKLFIKRAKIDTATYFQNNFR